MNIINFSELKDSHYFEISFNLNYIPLIPIIGFEGTSSLVNALYSSFIEHTTLAIKSRFPKEVFSFEMGETITFKSHDKRIHRFTLEIIKKLNADSDQIIQYIDKKDLQVEDEQKEFFDKIIPYRILDESVTPKNQHERCRGKI